MADFLLYWKEYWEEITNGGSIDEWWHTSRKSFWEAVVPGDSLWVVISGRSPSWGWYLLHRIHVDRKVIDSQKDRRYILIGDDDLGERFDISRQTDFETVMKTLRFRTQNPIAAVGRAIGNTIQTPRELGAEDVAILRDWLGSQTKSFRRPFSTDEVVLCAYASFYGYTDLGGIHAISGLEDRSYASIKMKVQNINSMLDERGIQRHESEGALSGLPRGKTGRSTNWSLISELLSLSQTDHLLRCQVILDRLSELPGELGGTEMLTEGASRRIVVNAYERDPRARKRCIAHYGATCVLCGFNFERIYGAEAKGFIHVHHLKPLSEIGTGYSVDPILDLRPVCPNCHAVIHIGGRTRSIEEMRELLQS